NEQRIAEYFHVKQSAIKIGNIPAGEALVTYYKTVIGQFAAPEYRGVELLHLDPVKLAKTIKPNATEVKELYELSKDSYNRAETREISQIIYPNMEAAQAAYEQSLKGTTFAELLAEQNIDVANATLGVFAKDGLPNKKMADVVFDLDINKISMPVDIGLGIVLLSVSNITPADIKTFDDVKQIIEDKESLRLAIDKIYELRDDVEDEIASGATFKEVADKLSIDLTIISTLNNQLQDIEGGKVSIPAVNGLAQSIFTSEIDLDNDPLDTISGGLIWFRVVNIIETRDKKLTEVKDDVTALWQSTETDKALLAKAKELSKKGGDIDALSNTFADAIKTTTELKRGDLNVDFSAQAIKALFSVKQGEYTYIAGNVNDEKSYIVMQLKEIIAPNNQDVDNINNQIRQAMAPNLAATLIESYVENNKQVYGTAINQPLIDRIVGEQPQY
ncbi:MAG: peptidyl-prolyl cis-trans isomerase, partial [Rhizobiales bacterium]|nr:peptidyl-prolyl cis-trans isomerase [Hyphomicrobiales bacterium]